MHPQVLPALEADPVWLCVCTRSIGQYLPMPLFESTTPGSNNLLNFIPGMTAVCPTRLPQPTFCDLLSRSQFNSGTCVPFSQGATLTWPSIAIGNVFNFGLRMSVRPCASPDASVQVSLRDNVSSPIVRYQNLRRYDWGTGRKRTPTMITGMTPDGIATIEVELSLTGELSATRLELKIGAFVNSSHYDSKIAG